MIFFNLLLRWFQVKRDTWSSQVQHAFLMVAILSKSWVSTTYGCCIKPPGKSWSATPFLLNPGFNKSTEDAIYGLGIKAPTFLTVTKSHAEALPLDAYSSNAISTIHHIRGRKNCTCNTITNSFQEVKDSRGNSVIHLHAYPFNEKGNNLNHTDSWEMFVNENGPRISTKFEDDCKDSRELTR